MKSLVTKVITKGILSLGLAGSLATFMPDSTNKLDKALIIVAMQKLFLDDVNKEELKREIPNHKKLIKKFQEKNLPIFVLESYSCGKTISELTDVLSDSDYKTIIKLSENGFEGTSLNQDLKNKGINEVFLAGVYATYCVRVTATGAILNNYLVFTSRDIISDPEDFKQEESRSWYIFNTILLNDVNEIINYVDKGSYKRD